MLLKQLNAVANIARFIKNKKKDYSFKFDDNGNIRIPFQMPFTISTQVDLKNYLIKLDVFEQLANCLESIKETQFDEFKNNKRGTRITVFFDMEENTGFEVYVRQGLLVRLPSSIRTSLDFENFFEDHFEEIVFRLAIYKRNILKAYPSQDSIYICFAYEFHEIDHIKR